MLQMMGSPTHGKKFEPVRSEAGLSMKERIDRDAEMAQQNEEIKRWGHYVYKYTVHGVTVKLNGLAKI